MTQSNVLNVKFDKQINAFLQCMRRLWCIIACSQVQFG